MSVDKSWTLLRDRLSDEYRKGVTLFVERAQNFLNQQRKIRCPCCSCLNISFQDLETVEYHLLIHGFQRSYQTWIFHGETFPAATSNPISSNHSDENLHVESVDPMINALNDLAGSSSNQVEHNDEETSHVGVDNHDESENFGNFDVMFESVERELYPGCNNFSELTFLVKLMHVKVLNKWSNKSFYMLLKLLKDAFPTGSNIPATHYEAKTLLRALGLGYESIHVCKNDCALFWKENAKLDKCPVCGESRWRNKDEKGKNVSHKTMRYFPVTPRLKRLYISRHTANDMRWHKEIRPNNDEVLRHPADAKAWKHIDQLYPTFASDSRNVRLGLASDGFNPFGNMSTSYSMWPVMLIPYNLPPWKCMKESFFMMALLIPGPKAPGKDMDIFLRPLIDELKELWETGAMTYDSVERKIFCMRAVLLWTINDLPAYGNLSGWTPKGYKACPICNDDTSSRGIRSKICYMCHRRYLPSDHRWRKDKQFDGHVENRQAPRVLEGDDLLRQLDHVQDKIPGKHKQYGGKKRKRCPEELNWSKRNAYFNAWG